MGPQADIGHNLVLGPLNARKRASDNPRLGRFWASRGSFVPAGYGSSKCD
jgi:hypothetical protein